MCLEPEANVVVLGQALDVKCNSIALFDQNVNCPATEAGADASAGHLAGQCLAHHDVFAMHLCKLIQVVAPRQLIPFAWERIHRQLDQVLAAHQIVENP